MVKVWGGGGHMTRTVCGNVYSVLVGETIAGCGYLVWECLLFLSERNCSEMHCYQVPLFPAGPLVSCPLQPDEDDPPGQVVSAPPVFMWSCSPFHVKNTGIRHYCAKEGAKEAKSHTSQAIFILIFTCRPLQDSVNRPPKGL